MPSMPYRQTGGEILNRRRAQTVCPAQKGLVGLAERSNTEKGGGVSHMWSVVPSDPVWINVKSNAKREEIYR